MGLAASLLHRVAFPILPPGAGGGAGSRDPHRPARRPGSAPGRVPPADRVDAEELGFCDSHGLWVLIDAQRRAEKRGGALRLIGVQGTLARLLTVTQLVDLFPPYSDLSHASSWPHD
ncbi:STAS domain-containing protein [Nonomuraea wenchangensis]